MDFLRDPFWQFIITAFIGIAGIIVPLLVGFFQSKSVNSSSPMSVSPSANPAGCWIVPTIIVSIVLIIFVVFSGVIFAFFSNILSHFPGQIPGLTSVSPDQVLTNFCRDIESTDYQDAYDQYSSKLKSEVGSGQFTQMWSGKSIGSCIHDPIRMSGNMAASTLTMQDFFTKQDYMYGVMLIQDGSNGWKIDTLQSQ